MGWYKNIWTVLVACCFLGTLRVSAQDVAIRTNLLYWATATPNLGAEIKMSPRWTAVLSLGYNPFTFADNKKFKHIAVQPEARYWFKSAFAGHFLGTNVLYTHYNAGGIKLPFGIWSELEDHRFQGNLGALGVAYGYNWVLPNRHWSIEASLGLGVGYTKYDKYACETCGSKVGEGSKWLFMPTRLSVSVVYRFL